MSALAELYCVVLMPLIMLITGALMWRFPAKYKGMGYHTARAESSPEAWVFAQYWCTRLMVFSHIPLLVLSIAAAAIGAAMELSEADCARLVFLITFIQLAVVFGVIIAVEVKLHKNFDKNGKPKH